MYNKEVPLLFLVETARAIYFKEAYCSKYLYFKDIIKIFKRYDILLKVFSIIYITNKLKKVTIQICIEIIFIVLVIISN